MALPTLEEGRDALTKDLLPREAKSQGIALPSVMRSTAAAAVFSGLVLFGLLAVLPSDEVTASRARKVTNVQPQLLVSDAAPAWFRLCSEQNVFCDMRHNIRDELDFEARWAYEFLDKVSQDEDKLDLYLSFFHRLREHIAETRSSRGPDCQQLESWTETQEFWKKEGINVGKTGRSVANYADANHVLYKKAEDSTHKGPSNCSWSPGAPGWGAKMAVIELAMKGDRALMTGQVYRATNETPGYELLPEGVIQDSNKYMWAEKKGRGVDMDKVAMSLDIDRSVVTDAMGKTINAVFTANKGETDEQRSMPAWRQRLLPGSVRWDATFMNANFGIFSYGDGDGWVQTPDSRDFFYNRNVHGFGIFGRNLTEGNPAERMLDAGMPWIGGSSGSLIDFYLAARDLGYKGEDLANLMVIDMAALIAGGHHSLGELLVAAVEADRAGGEMSFQKENKSFNFFDGPLFGKLLDIMNTISHGEYRAASDALAPEGGLPALYAAALDEFMSRAGPVSYTRSSSTVDSRIRENFTEMPALERCIKLPGTSLFKTGVFKLGGPERAFANWKIEDLQDFKDGLSPAEFVTKLGATAFSRVGLYATAAFKEIAGSSSSITEKDLDAYIHGKSDGTLALVESLRPLKHNLAKSLWGSSASWEKYIPNSAGKASHAKGAAAFSAAVLSSVNEALLEVHGCIADATGVATQDAVQSLYSMACLA